MVLVHHQRLIVVKKMESVIIVLHNVVEVVVDQRKFPVEVKIVEDQDQGKTNIINN